MNVNKAPDAFRTISEVAEDLDLPQHVLRFWETRFPQIKPLKRGGGRRYYRPDDVLLLRGIRHLLYGEGYTIKGVQRIIREEGARHVMALWQDNSDQAGYVSSPDYNSALSSLKQDPQAYAPPTHREQYPLWSVEDNDPDHSRSDEDGDYTPLSEDFIEDDFSQLSEAELAVPAFIEPKKIQEIVHISPDTAQLKKTPPAQPAGLSGDDNRKLQATLYELMECKRILQGIH